MARDFKVTSRIEKETYLQLRSRLMMSGTSFSTWLQSKIESDVKKEFDSKKFNLVEYQEPKLIEQPEEVIIHKEIKKSTKAAKSPVKICKHGYAVNLCKKGCK